MRIIYLYADSQHEWNCSEWRCHKLANAINWNNEQRPKEFPHTAKMLLLPSALDIHHPKVQDMVGAGDVIVFQRNVLSEAIWRAMDYWRALNRVVLVDLDDHYPNIPASNPAFAHWHLNGLNLDPPAIERLRIGLRDHADALISPSKVILEDWDETVPGYYWPNYPSLLEYGDLKQKVTGGPDPIFVPEKDNLKVGLREGEDGALIEGDIIIGWGGSLSHVDSFKYSGVIEGMRRLMLENPKVKFKFCGHETRLDFLMSELPEGAVIRQPGVAPTQWPMVLQGFDIGIAPMDMRLVDSVVKEEPGGPKYSYDERRSWLKLVEYLCAGVPFVATRCASYAELGRHGKLVDNMPDDWYAGLKSRVDSIALFKEEAWKARRWALKRLTIENNADRLIALYDRIGKDTQVRKGAARLPDVLYVTGGHQNGSAQ